MKESAVKFPAFSGTALSTDIKPVKKEHRGAHIYHETKEDAGNGNVYWVAADNNKIKIAAKPYHYTSTPSFKGATRRTKR